MQVLNWIAFGAFALLCISQVSQLVFDIHRQKANVWLALAALFAASASLTQHWLWFSGLTLVAVVAIVQMHISHAPYHRHWQDKHKWLLRWLTRLSLITLLLLLWLQQFSFILLLASLLLALTALFSLLQFGQLNKLSKVQAFSLLAFSGLLLLPAVTSLFAVPTLWLQFPIEFAIALLILFFVHCLQFGMQQDHFSELSLSKNKGLELNHQLYQAEQKVESLTHDLQATEQMLDEAEEGKGSQILELEMTLRELQDENQKLEAMTQTDQLTGVKNRAFFDKKLMAEYRRSRREQTMLSLIMLDIDHFKSVNDNHGHPAGDDALRAVSRIAKDNLKRPADSLCRYGGEEFAIILPITDSTGAKLVAEQLRQAIAAESIATCAGPLELTASLGIASIVATIDRPAEAMLHAADKALYQAKEGGRNQSQIAKPEFFELQDGV